MYRSFTSFVKFILRDFILLFFCSSKYILLLIYRNTTGLLYWLCILKLSCVCLLFLTAFGEVREVFKVFFINRIMSSAKSDTFTSSFPVWMPFISFSCLITLSRTSRTVLNRSGKSEHPCLVLDFRGKTFRFLLFSMILAEDLSHMSLLFWDTFFLFLFHWVF